MYSFSVVLNYFILSVEFAVGVHSYKYLFLDIPCRSDLCFEDCSHKQPGDETHPTLPADVTHYLIPLPDAATTFMEILELPEITGVIFPQTVVNSIQQVRTLQHQTFSSYCPDYDKPTTRSNSPPCFIAISAG